MARLNIEDIWFDDPRRELLKSKVGFAADSVALAMWRLAQNFWKRNLSVPRDLYFRMTYASEFLEAGLAEDRGDSGIYIKGSNSHFEWMHQAIQEGRKGGLASAEARKKKFGSSNPRALKICEPPVNPPSGFCEAREPSSSSSSSSSESESKNIYISSESLKPCIEEWGKTLSRLGIKKSPKFDEFKIAELVKRYGYEQTLLALRGAGFEAASKNYDPSKHVRISRLTKPEIFELFVNLGSQNAPQEFEVTEWDVTNA